MSAEDEQHSLLCQPLEKHLYWYAHIADALTSGSTSARALSMSIFILPPRIPYLLTIVAIIGTGVGGRLARR